MATYPEMVKLVLDWSNRDFSVFNNDERSAYRMIKKFIDYAQDNAFRKLRIAPQETTVTYQTLSASDVGDLGNLSVPHNLIEMIQLRRRGRDRTTSETASMAQYPQYAYDVYNSKADIQSFYEDGFWKYGDDYVYTRERDKFRVFPCAVDDVFELYYYRRLPSAHQIREYTGDEVITSDNIADFENFFTTVNSSQINNTGIEYDPDVSRIVLDDVTYYGVYTDNWLRDENERVILFGALAEAFDYLNEPEQSQKFHQRFELEVTRLNAEDKMRMGSGGNVQVRYSGQGLI